jgi:hypothetical protein
MVRPEPRPHAARFLLRAAVVLGAALSPIAVLASHSVAEAKVTADGSAAGELAPGNTIKVRVHATDSEGWQRLARIEVSLELRGAPLDQLIVEPSAFAISIAGSDAPVSIGEPGTLRGNYFLVDNAKVTVSAKGDAFDLTFPLRLSAEPPPGARLVLLAQDASGVSSGDVALTPPVTQEEKGFPWGTIGLAVAAALFIGAFVGNMFSTRRSSGRTNVYATVARRLDEERAKK